MPWLDNWTEFPWLKATVTPDWCHRADSSAKSASWVGEGGLRLGDRMRRVITCAFITMYASVAFLRPVSAEYIRIPHSQLKVADHVRPLGAALVVAYYVDYDPNSWITLLTQGHRLSWIITTTFGLVDERGTLQGTPEPGVLEVAHNLGAKVHFRVTNFVRGDFRRNIAHAVLTRPIARTQTLRSILRILDTYDYDGINVDLENVPPQDRAALTRFVADLSETVGPRGKALSISVPPKTRDRLVDDWNGAFDLAALSRVSDSVIVMAYDEHWSTSAPGPVAPLPWVDAVIQFAVREVGPEKLLLGVPFYGYDWPKRGPATGVSMREAVSRATREGVRIRWDEHSQVPYYETAFRTVYFENARSIERKLSVATRRGLAGVAAWRLGHELPEVWDVIDAYLAHPRSALSSASDSSCAFTEAEPKAIGLVRMPTAQSSRRTPVEPMLRALNECQPQIQCAVQGLLAKDSTPVQAMQQYVLEPSCTEELWGRSSKLAATHPGWEESHPRKPRHR